MSKIFILLLLWRKLEPYLDWDTLFGFSIYLQVSIENPLFRNKVRSTGYKLANEILVPNSTVAFANPVASNLCLLWMEWERGKLWKSHLLNSQCLMLLIWSEIWTWVGEWGAWWAVLLLNWLIPNVKEPHFSTSWFWLLASLRALTHDHVAYEDENWHSYCRHVMWVLCPSPTTVTPKLSLFFSPSPVPPPMLIF